MPTFKYAKTSDSLTTKPNNLMRTAREVVDSVLYIYTQSEVGGIIQRGRAEYIPLPFGSIASKIEVPRPWHGEPVLAEGGGGGVARQGAGET